MLERSGLGPMQLAMMGLQHRPLCTVMRLAVGLWLLKSASNLLKPSYDSTYLNLILSHKITLLFVHRSGFTHV